MDVKVFIITPEERKNSTQIFNSFNLVNGLLTGIEAKNYLMRSGLPTSILAPIWELSDTDKDGNLSLVEFILAKKFVELSLKNVPPPRIVPPQMMNSALGSYDNSNFNQTNTAPRPHTQTDMNLFPSIVPSSFPQAGGFSQSGQASNIPKPNDNQLFSSSSLFSSAAQPEKTSNYQDFLATTSNSHNATLRELFITTFNLNPSAKATGKITGLDARPIFKNSGLPDNVLKRIWDETDLDRDGKLTLEEFVKAMFLIESAKSEPQQSTTIPTDRLTSLFKPTASSYQQQTSVVNPKNESQKPPSFFGRTEDPKQKSAEEFLEKQRQATQAILDKERIEFERFQKIEEEKRIALEKSKAFTKSLTEMDFNLKMNIQNDVAVINGLKEREKDLNLELNTYRNQIHTLKSASGSAESNVTSLTEQLSQINFSIFQIEAEKQKAKEATPAPNYNIDPFQSDRFSSAIETKVIQDPFSTSKFGQSQSPLDTLFSNSHLFETPSSTPAPASKKSTDPFSTPQFVDPFAHPRKPNKEPDDLFFDNFQAPQKSNLPSKQPSQDLDLIFGKAKQSDPLEFDPFKKSDLSTLSANAKKTPLVEETCLNFSQPVGGKLSKNNQTPTDFVIDRGGKNYTINIQRGPKASPSKPEKSNFSIVSGSKKNPPSNLKIKPHQGTRPDTANVSSSNKNDGGNQRGRPSTKSISVQRLNSISHGSNIPPVPPRPIKKTLKTSESYQPADKPRVSPRKETKTKGFSTSDETTSFAVKTNINKMDNFVDLTSFRPNSQDNIFSGVNKSSNGDNYHKAFESIGSKTHNFNTNAFLDKNLFEIPEEQSQPEGDENDDIITYDPPLAGVANSYFSSPELEFSFKPGDALTILYKHGSHYYSEINEIGEWFRCSHVDLKEESHRNYDVKNFRIALFDNEAEESDDVEFSQGDVVIVSEEMNEWLRGYGNGKDGIFPTEFVSYLTNFKLSETCQVIRDFISSSAHELDLRSGDTVVVVHKNKSGWCLGHLENDDKIGSFHLSSVDSSISPPLHGNLA